MLPLEGSYLHCAVCGWLAGRERLPCPCSRQRCVREEHHHDHASCAGQNLSEPSKLGCVDLDAAHGGAHGPGSHIAQKSAGRRVTLEASMLNYVLQEDSSARNRQSVRSFCWFVAAWHAPGLQ